MKVGLIVPGGVDRSGEERVIPALLALVERLARHHEVHVFALRQEPTPSRFVVLGAVVHNIGESGSRRTRALRVIEADHRARPFAVLHAFWAQGPGTLAAVAGWRHRIPVLLHLAGGELIALPEIGYGGRLSWRGRLGLRLALAGATRVTAATTPMIRSAAALGVRAERVPLGVALDRWPPRAPRPGDRSREARLLHVASLNPVKDQFTLLRAAALLRDAQLRFRLDIVGVDTLRGGVQRHAELLRLGSVVRFHGALRHDQVRALMDRADLLLLSSRHEAGPLVVLEAAVAGVPTVGTCVGHVAEWASEAAVGVPVGDADALARETAALLGDDARRLSLAHEAQQRAVGEDADETARRFERIYEEIADMRTDVAR